MVAWIRSKLDAGLVFKYHLIRGTPLVVFGCSANLNFKLRHIHIPYLFLNLRDSVCPLHARDPCGGENERGVLAALLIVQLPQPRVQVAPDVGDRQMGVSRPVSWISLVVLV